MEIKTLTKILDNIIKSVLDKTKFEKGLPIDELQYQLGYNQACLDIVADLKTQRTILEDSCS